MALLAMTAVSKTYRSRRGATEVLRDANLSVERGELVAIVGYSGAGKSTLLSILAGLVPPCAGAVTMDGKPITGPGPERAVVFQSYSLLPWLSVEDNVRLAVDRVFRSWSWRRRRDQVDKYVALVGLAQAAHKRPAELSGGMRQRVAVARALAMEPAVLLMDEPFGALDALTRSGLQDGLARLCAASGRTTVMVTNDVDEALLLADRVVPLSHGPAATLGPAVVLDLPRPRDRRTLADDARFGVARAQILDYLLHSGGRRRPALSAPPLAMPQAATVTVPEERCA